MTDTGRYYVIDMKSGRKFCVETISARNQRSNDKEWEVGGAQSVEGGSVRREDSIIKESNGFKNIGECKNPMDHINKLLAKKLNG